MPEIAEPTAVEVRRDPAAKQRAIEYLWQLDRMPGRRRQPYLFAILDAARDERIYPGLQWLAATEEILPLYQGPTANELASVAPYLICLGTSDGVFDWIWQEGWGESWGIFLWSLVSPQILREHFRRLTIVRTEEGQRLLFRFYDPRVLRVFLPTCDAAQVMATFGPVQRFIMEAGPGALAGAALNAKGRIDFTSEPIR